MEVEQINLAVEVRTGERDGRVSRHVGFCLYWVGLPQGHVIEGHVIEGLVGHSGKDFLGIVK